MSPEQARALVAVIESPVVEKAFGMLARGEAELSVRKTLEKTLDASTCLAVLDCLSTRLRFPSKFEHVEQWLLTREAAEQATDSRIARWRADWLATHAPAGDMTEVGCGIGADSRFLASHFMLNCYEKDGARAILAAHNLKSLNATVHQQEADLSGLHGTLLFVDPARRDGSRISDPEAWSPPLSEVTRCFTEERFSWVAVKCAPGLKTESLPPGQLFFLSINGAMKEAFFVLSPQGKSSHAAVMFFKDEAEPRILYPNEQTIPVSEPTAGRYLHNPDPAILRAGALNTLAEALQAEIVHPKIGYLIGSRPSPDALAVSFLIIDTFRLNWKTLKKKMLSSEFTEYEYLGRGVPFSQSDVRKKIGKLPGKGGSRGSIIIYREESGYRVVMARRVER